MGTSSPSMFSNMGLLNYVFDKYFIESEIYWNVHILMDQKDNVLLIVPDQKIMVDAVFIQ